MTFKNDYTTSRLKTVDLLLPIKDQTEQTKTEVSEEAFLNADLMEKLIFRLTRLGNG